MDSSLSISRLIESILEGRGLQSYKRFGINASLQDFYLLPGSEASILRDEDLLILETSNANAKMDNAGIELNAKRKRLAEEKEFPPSKANQPAKVPSRSARRKAAKRRYKRLKLASNGIEAHKNESGGSHRSSMDPSTGTDKRNPVALDFDKSLQDTPRDLKLNDAMEMQYGPGRGLEYEKLELCNGMPLPNTFIAYRLLEPGADGVPKVRPVLLR